MKHKKLAMFVALVALVGLGSVPAGAQEATEVAERALVSDPLSNYTLDVMIPARSEEQTSAMMGIAKTWHDMANDYKSDAKKARELVKSRLSVKQTEIKTLEARGKEAKKVGDSAEVEKLKAEIKVQKNQVDALKRIQAYSSEWDDHANALENAAKAWIAFLEAENGVAKQRAKAANRAKGADDPVTAGLPTPEDFKAHKNYADLVRRHGNGMENLGKSLKQLADSASKVLSDWESRNPVK